MTKDHTSQMGATMDRTRMADPIFISKEYKEPLAWENQEATLEDMVDR